MTPLAVPASCVCTPTHVQPNRAERRRMKALGQVGGGAVRVHADHCPAGDPAGNPSAPRVRRQL